MNNPFEFQNDLNGFRSAIVADQQNYDNKVSILQSTQLAKRTKALNKAKAFIEKGEELTKQGLEAAAVPHLSKLIYKGGKSIYSKIRSRTLLGEKPVTKILQKVTEIFQVLLHQHKHQKELKYKMYHLREEEKLR